MRLDVTSLTHPGEVRSPSRPRDPNGCLVEVLYEQVFVQPQLAELDGEVEARILELYAEILRNGQRAGELRPELNPSLAARLVVDVWSATPRVWVTSGRRESLGDALAKKLSLLFAGLNAR